MPKCLMVDPNEKRKATFIQFTPIPVNQYSKTVRDELSRYTKEDLVRIQRDMLILRTFETMLNEIKLRGSYMGIEYMHNGPAHLSIGQEAAAVGQAFHLGIDDHIYGSHRSHGEILAKGLSAIQKLDDAALMQIMKNYFDGQCLKIVEKDAAGSVKDLAIDFLIYGTLAEIFGREAGFNKGMGGSMHAFFPPFGIYPNNAIVGGSGDIAVGAALYKKVNKKSGIVIANIGDASSSCGPVWEGLCFATMEQFKTLWDEAHRGGLPLIVNFNNNFYGMGGQPEGETMGFGMLARLGAGLNPQQMHAERIDGYNPLAVADAVLRKRQILEQGDGPVLLDTITYRYSGHSPSDQSSYREKTEVEAWQQHDPIVHFAKELAAAGICEDQAIDAIRQHVEQLIIKACRKAVDKTISPRADLKKANCLLDQTMYSNQKMDSMEPGRKPEVLLSKDQNPRVQALTARSRSAFDETGQRLKDSRCVVLRDALFEAILDRFYADPTLVAYGEENRDWGGAFAVYRGLTEALPYHRLFNAPIAEGAIVGTAVGYALEGGRALVELMYCDFLGRAGDEIFNQLCKWQSMSGGLLKMPVVVRVSVGSKYGAQHSQDWTSLCAHIPGLKVVFPATPYDAKGLMYAALTGTDPVIFFESQRLYGIAEEFVQGGVPLDYYEVPFGQPAVRREGRDLTILTIGATLYRALEAAKQLEQNWGLTCEVIDARSLVPFNYEPVIESVKKTRKILLASDACQRGSFLHTMASTIGLLAFDELDAPPVVLGARNWITPPDEVEDAFFPYPSDFLDMIHEHILPLKGYQVKRPCSAAELIRRSKAAL
ncbi:MAG TPA: thiamine pyrophosphate-dependent enzyme [Anaerohalosphaeraceae bacterium]|nr:thiamine pyrophosphate-dependent enzyme [Anaerohalosphaeraceae bacterium]HOM76536.1 thiamine pyrophosphate-dependent enzyme [Anaerohalosphaeraceae bacterium]HPC63693.1 thiamine pyrophosphate-dependent enzyme [Anaerohalosphaeraceae bacterium]HRS71924.1 thiamine pyrophosphate-dependent enzyme [Anaerohalosphaeraceae bacterium]HRV19907.1 thiamine pyrophosphate-dependent enzyme [Anaerohalosphaeraceae bacterium]